MTRHNWGLFVYLSLTGSCYHLHKYKLLILPITNSCLCCSYIGLSFNGMHYSTVAQSRHLSRHIFFQNICDRLFFGSHFPSQKYRNLGLFLALSPSPQKNRQMHFCDEDKGPHAFLWRGRGTPCIFVTWTRDPVLVTKNTKQLFILSYINESSKRGMRTVVSHFAFFLTGTPKGTQWTSLSSHVLYFPWRALQKGPNEVDSRHRFGFFLDGHPKRDLIKNFLVTHFVFSLTGLLKGNIHNHLQFN